MQQPVLKLKVRVLSTLGLSPFILVPCLSSHSARAFQAPWEEQQRSPGSKEGAGRLTCGWPGQYS